ncbi:MAG TPA: molybdopterin-dependent oxidoreductase, partial [Kofleriaceae bacterium]|nr:molybdopterin-dependent oxidoreductase [Kofleriaceae bacterium]
AGGDLGTAYKAFLGKPLDRLDGPMKVDGSAIFGIDVTRPGMVQAVVVRSPVRGGTVTSFDAATAVGALDVFAIETGVAVVAPTYWQARRAADSLQLEWAHGAFAEVTTSSLRRSYHAMARQPGETLRSQGDAERALGRAPVALDATYELPYLSHTPMEPMNATAHVQDGRCEVWAPTQAPGIARAQVADALGLDQRDVEIHTTMLGGGFGRRLVQDYAVEAARIAARVGKPVKVTWSREDDQNNDFYRPMAVSRVRGAVDAAGTPVAWSHHLVTQSILADVGEDFIAALAPAGAPRPLARFATKAAPAAFRRGVMVDQTAVEGAKELPYAIPHLRVAFTEAHSAVKAGFWRAVGHSHTAFVTESFLDELAHAGKQDPVALRRRLLRDHPRHLRVLERVASEAGWGSPLPAGVGRGVAVHASFRSVCAQVIEASVEPASDGRGPGTIRIHRVVAALDCGRVVNPQLVRAQVESAVVFGLSAALRQQITFEAGRVQETNFHRYRLLRLHECPRIEVHLIDSEEDPTGVGEPPLPPVAGALGNALFAATGRRLRRLPFELALAEPDLPATEPTP